MTKAKTTDTGFIAWSTDGAVGHWRFRLAPGQEVVDRDTGRSPVGSQSFVARIDWDPNAHWHQFTVVTCGPNGRGATRYRSFATAADATEVLLKWLDRRFKVVVDEEVLFDAQVAAWEASDRAVLAEIHAETAAEEARIAAAQDEDDEVPDAPVDAFVTVRYVGEARSGNVWREAEDGERRPLTHYVAHSPGGFAWGYHGSGPADLARALFCDAVGEPPAEVEGFAFRVMLEEIVARLPWPWDFAISREDVVSWIDSKEAEYGDRPTVPSGYIPPGS